MSHSLRVLAMAAWLGVAGSASAAQVKLFELGINRDGVLPTPPGVTYALDASGLGAVRVLVAGAGDHSVIGYFDFDIGDAADDDFGGTGGAPGAAHGADFAIALICSHSRPISRSSTCSRSSSWATGPSSAA